MKRILLLVVNVKPAGDVKVFVDYVLSPKGQEIVRKHGFIGVSDLPAKTVPSSRARPAL